MSELIQKEILRDKIFGVVRDWILEGEFQPGERIVESTLATRLGVSRAPLREALWLLSHHGLVHIEAHQSARVTTLSAEEIRDIFEVRESLEVLAARKIRRTLTAAKRARLDEVLGRMRKAAKARDLRAWVDTDHLFHRTLWDLADNRQLVTMLADISARFFSYGLMRDLQSEHPFRFDEVTAEHEEMARLVCEGSDAEIAAGFARSYASFLEYVLLRFGQP